MKSKTLQLLVVVVVVVVGAGGCTKSPAKDVGVDGSLPQVQVPRVQGAVVVDGVLDEADWQRATALQLQPYRDHSPLTQATTARLLWSSDALYLSFDAADDDAFSPYQKRDDPLYEGEAYELFIDADGDRDVYVELQSNAFDLHFDSAFAGGSRQHMEVGYDVDFVTKTVIGGGRVVQEWRIPVAALRDVPAGEPKAGTKWQANLFRLERRRQAGRVVSAEASAWSPPQTNDFHNLQRFGSLVFVD